MGRFGWFITGLILGVIITLGTIIYLKSAREAPAEKAAAPVEAVIEPAEAPPLSGPGAAVAVAPPAARPAAAAPVRSRPTVRQDAEEVAEDAAAVGMTTRRPATAPRSDSAPITEVPY